MIEGTDPGILGYGTEETVQIGTVKKQKRKKIYALFLMEKRIFKQLLTIQLFLLQIKMVMY